jgi:outer membrane immunogenic protein
MYDWSGFYIGANGGWGSSRNCWGIIPAGGVTIADGCASRSGGVFGGQLGYRWQSGQWVFGLEGQGDWADLGGRRVSVFNPLFQTGTRVDALGLITGQIGYAWNASLFYLKGGAATKESL